MLSPIDSSGIYNSPFLIYIISLVTGTCRSLLQPLTLRTPLSQSQLYFYSLSLYLHSTSLLYSTLLLLCFDPTSTLLLLLPTSALHPLYVSTSTLLQLSFSTLLRLYFSILLVYFTSLLYFDYFYSTSN